MPVYTNYSGELAAKIDDYRSRGQREAASHRPPTDATQMDQYESALQTDAQRWFASEQRLFDNTLIEVGRALSEGQQKAAELKHTVSQLMLDASLLSTVETDMAGDRSALIRASESRMRAEVDLRHLRVANGITSEAVYPDSLIMHLAIVLFLALVETFLNAFFYENEGGLLGGYAVALGVAAINMIGALGLGYWFRYSNVRNVEQRLLGWSSLAAFIVLTIYCNALFSTFRSEFQVIADVSDAVQVRAAFAAAAAEAKKVFLFDMQFADLTSFVLFGVGLLLSIGAFLKGYTFDDKYPKHGSLDRRVKHLRKLESELQDLLRQRVKDALHSRRADVQVALNEPSLILGLIARRSAELANAVTSLQTQTAMIQREFGMVLTAYRNANASVRAADVPAYFKLMPDLTGATNAGGSLAVGAELEKLRVDITAARDAYQESLSSKLQQLQAESSEILKVTFDRFLRETESEAEERINRSVSAVHRATKEVA